MCVQRLPLREVVLALLAAILPQAANWEVVGRLCFCSDVTVYVWVCVCEMQMCLNDSKAGQKRRF